MLTLAYSTAAVFAVLFAAVGLWIPTAFALVVAFAVLAYCFHSQHIAPYLRHFKV